MVLTIKTRLILFFFVLISLPLLTVSLTSYFRFSAYAKDITVKSKFEMSKSAIEEINIIKERDERVSDQIILNKTLQDALYSGDLSDNLQRYAEKKDTNMFLSNMTDTTNVSGIALIGSNGKEYMSKNVDLLSIKDSEDVKNLMSDPVFVKSRGNAVWIPASKNIFISPFDGKYLRANQLYLYIVRKINKLDNTKQEIGICIIQYVYDRLKSVLKNTASGDGEFCILTDMSGIILCHTQNNALIGTKLDSFINDKIKTGLEGSFYNTVNGTDYLMLYIKSKTSGWTIIQGVPKKNLFEESVKIRNFTFAIMLLCLFAATILSVFFSKNITDPIMRLKKVIEKFASGNLKSRSKTDRKDEIGQLQSSFNFMTEEIQNLLEKNEEEHKQRRMLELSVLEYQINPHFLYNTLDSINWMAQKSGQKEIGDMVTALARFFRTGLSKGKEFIKLKDELEHAYNYLLISKMRYKDCFSFQFDVQEEISECRTIKLILQPVLENSIKHGLDKRSESGKIEICGFIEDEKVLLTVTDNGKGIRREKLEEVKKMLQENHEPECTENGIGLLNVNQRIKLNFGVEYGLDIDSEEGQWTKVTIRIPVLRPPQSA